MAPLEPPDRPLPPAAGGSPEAATTDDVRRVRRQLLAAVILALVAVAVAVAALFDLLGTDQSLEEQNRSRVQRTEGRLAQETEHERDQRQRLERAEDEVRRLTRQIGEQAERVRALERSLDRTADIEQVTELERRLRGVENSFGQRDGLITSLERRVSRLERP